MKLKITCLTASVMAFSAASAAFAGNTFDQSAKALIAALQADAVHAILDTEGDITKIELAENGFLISAGYCGLRAEVTPTEGGNFDVLVPEAWCAR